jgi:hypothetical protein
MVALEALSAVSANMCRDSEIDDVLVMLLLFFLCENLHDELCVWCIEMGKWDAIGRAAGTWAF